MVNLIVFKMLIRFSLDFGVVDIKKYCEKYERIGWFNNVVIWFGICFVWCKNGLIL